MYLLSTKLFCGKCVAYMVGESGTGRTGTFYQYYKCASVKNHKNCDKKIVRKNGLKILELQVLMDKEYIKDISQKLYNSQFDENTVIPQIKKQISETEKAINNLVNAMEQGIITALTKYRLQTLEKTNEN